MTKAVTHSVRRLAPRTLRAYLTGPPSVSQRALAEAVNCNQSMISMLARGRRMPSARLAVKLHAITGVPLKALLARKPPTEEAKSRREQLRAAARGDPVRPPGALTGS